MKKELQDKLFADYPLIFAQKDLPMTQTCMCWGIDTGDGWYDLIDTLCATIQHHIDYGEDVPQVEAVQVKEKFGGLRFYINGGDDEIQGMIDMAEEMSYRICETCGVPGRPNDEGWITTLCDSCRNPKAKTDPATESEDGGGVG